MDIALVDRDNHGRLGRDVDLAVVVGRRLLRSPTGKIGNRGGDRIPDQRADVLQDGHRLLTIDDVLDGRYLRVLAGHDVAGDILVGSKHIGNGARRAVVRGQDAEIPSVQYIIDGKQSMKIGRASCRERV